MLKSKKSIYAFGLLVAVITMGIGFASATQTLKVNGTATALPNNSFDVFFTNAAAGTATTTASSTAAVGSGSNPKTATMSVSLTNLNDTQTCTFTVKNGSQTGVGAQFTDASIKICNKDTYNTSTGTCTTYSSNYFTVTRTATNLTSAVLSSGQSKTFTVTVTLKKVNAGTSNVTENFDVILGNITPVQE